MIAILCMAGCQKQAEGSSSNAPAQTASKGGTPASGGMTVVTPDVGPVTPVTSSALDNAGGGGVNSAALKKAKGIAANGVGSVNNAQKQGYGTTDEGN